MALNSSVNQLVRKIVFFCCRKCKRLGYIQGETVLLHADKHSEKPLSGISVHNFVVHKVVN